MDSQTRAEGLADVAGLLSDRTRATFCVALLDGRAWTARELAGYAGVAPSTASEHLSRLVAGGLLTERRQGRHRYLQVADPSVAALLEDLVAYVNPPPAPVRSLRAAAVSDALARGRTCYDHLAGRLGVAVTDALIRTGRLDHAGGFALTDSGFTWITSALGVDGAVLRSRRRPVARACLDWTERRSHLAGAAGAAVCRAFLEHAWVRRIADGRAVRLTPAGQVALRDLLEVDAAASALV